MRHANHAGSVTFLNGNLLAPNESASAVANLFAVRAVEAMVDPLSLHIHVANVPRSERAPGFRRPLARRKSPSKAIK
jgi:hypothetical protein